MHLSATAVVEIAESTNLKGTPHTFVYIVHMNILICMCLLRSSANLLTVQQLPVFLSSLGVFLFMRLNRDHGLQRHMDGQKMAADNDLPELTLDPISEQN